MFLKDLDVSPEGFCSCIKEKHVSFFFCSFDILSGENLHVCLVLGPGCMCLTGGHVCFNLTGELAAQLDT